MRKESARKMRAERELLTDLGIFKKKSDNSTGTNLRYRISFANPAYPNKACDRTSFSSFFVPKYRSIDFARKAEKCQSRAFLPSERLHAIPAGQ